MDPLHNRAQATKAVENTAQSDGGHAGDGAELTDKLVEQPPFRGTWGRLLVTWNVSSFLGYSEGYKLKVGQIGVIMRNGICRNALLSYSGPFVPELSAA